jgi:predicted AlkP superfamily pyrophosphatase or phosphodiesterase
MIREPNYASSILGIPCSILRRFGLEANHASLPLLDEFLDKGYEKIVLLLFDGLGVDILRRHLPEDSFLRGHMAASLSSVFPPTTTAATTSIITGLSPAEHGRLGWSLYFRELDSIVNLYPNTLKNTETQAAAYHVANRYLPAPTIMEKIAASGRARSHMAAPFGDVQARNMPELMGAVRELCRVDTPLYLYGYHTEPDSRMHEVGRDGDGVADIIREIDRAIEELCASLRDTLVLVTADHGMTDTGYYILSDDEVLANMLVRPPSMEARAAAFAVKPAYLEDFPRRFRMLYGDDFLLLSRREVGERQLFGSGNPHPRFEEFIGDYLAVAIGDKGLVYDQRSSQFAANHAGLTEEEILVPLVVVET